ncbi:hypothetical protein [Agarilytica rhodophyticola]|uniref:hypothetical protein n=1 Tax=Agarilytica rhodophyticola TaxID=1737490 RepID=UPI000B3456DF|nr:hypothetical protein [Agarilytica rhodophyticola]
MHYDVREPWEAWALVPAVIGVVAIPIIIGHFILELYYKIRPAQENEKVSLSTLGDNNKSDFFKKLLIGWLICAPIFYWVHSLVY